MRHLVRHVTLRWRGVERGKGGCRRGLCEIVGGECARMATSVAIFGFG